MKKKIFGIIALLTLIFSIASCYAVNPDMKGEQGIQGEPGIQGEQGVPGKDGVGVVSIEKLSNNENVDTYRILYSDGSESFFNVTNGINGSDGSDGEDGKDGVGINNVTVNNDGEAILEMSDGSILNIGKIVGSNGENGIDGVDGVGVLSAKVDNDGRFTLTLTNGAVIDLGNINGEDGKDGVNGKDGISITKSEINANGELVFTFSNGNTVNVGKVVGSNGTNGSNGSNGSNGEDGKDGVDGVGIANVALNGNNLVITLTNGTVIDLGNIKGADGKNGIDGEDGKDGVDGVSVIKSEINANGELVLYYSNSTSTNLGKVVGSNGSNGVDGNDGKDGVGIQTVKVDENGNLSVTLTTGVTLNLGNIKGPQGDKGDNGIDGVSVVDAEINNDGELIFTLSNGEKINVGKIIGSNGINGSNGTNGVDGVGIKGIAFNANGELIITLTDNSTINCGKVPACSHSYSSWSTVSEANCTSMGVKVRTCSKCGFEDYDFVSSTGHSYKNTVVKASCTAQGYTLHECSKCDYEYRDAYTVKAAHSYGDWTEMLSTCTTKVLSQSCTVCGSSSIKSESGSWHNYTTSVIAPTCFEQGYTLHSCSNCGNYYKDSFVNATGTHTWQNLYVVSSTCAEKKTLVICTVCNKTRVIDDIPTVEHNYEEFYCTVCGKRDPSIWDGSIATSFAGGSGTEDDPYLISTGDQLAYLAYCINSGDNSLYDKHYELINNIDLGYMEWDPIGSFQGVFNGNGYTISNLKINEIQSNYSSSSYNIGLFGYTYGAEIIELNVEGVEINVTTSMNHSIRAGGITGYAWDTYFEKCSFSGKIYASTATKSVYVGGITGYSSGDCTYTRCNTICDIKSISTEYFSYAGGIVAMGDGIFRNCSSDGFIESRSSAENTTYICSGTYAGGIIGCVDVALITESYSSATILAESFGTTGSMAGGIAAKTTSNASCSCTIENCYTTGNISALSHEEWTTNGVTYGSEWSYAGGIMGSTCNRDSIINSYSTGDMYALSVTVYAYAGGITGDGDAKIANCFAIGDVSADGKKSSYVNGVSGSYNSSNHTNNYQYEGQVLTKNGEIITSTKYDVCSIDQLNSTTFYIDVLGWDTSVWDITNFDFENGKIPTLK